MMKTHKKLFVSILSVLAVSCLSLGFVFKSEVKASAETPQLASSLVMKNGASVRINKTDNYEDNGIRFSALISNEEYETVCRMDNAVFGMFIMPESYLTRFGDLTAENVNIGGVYDWKENGSEEYFYGGDEIQAESHRILAMTYTQLPDDASDDDYKVIHGSVVSIKDENLDMNYVGRAFIRYEVDGFYFYEMAEWYDGYVDNNVRSVTYVAKKALADKNSALSIDEKNALNDAYTAKSLAVQGYTAITTAEDFAAMSANGKYYLANDITISTAYANEFTGVFNGNGKTITANGVSLFTSLAGTITDVKTTTNAAVIGSLNGGLVDGITVNYTYSDGAVNAIAASSTRTARVENSIVYTDNSKTNYLPEGGAFVTNCVKTTDSSAVYNQITFAGLEGKITKLIKNGADVSNEFVYGASSTLAGTVNSWNKEFATVNGDAAYYATDYETVYDDTAEWTKIADSGITGATAGSAPAPYGYNKVNVGAMTWATTSIANCTSVRFAAKLSGYFLLSGWSIYSDANDWMQIVMDKQENGSWTVTVHGPVFNGSAWVNSYQKTDITATTVAEAMAFVTFGSYTTYATEVCGVKVESNDTEVVAQALKNSSVVTSEVAPAGFEKVYSQSGFAKGDFAATDISGYETVRFQMKANSWILFDGWSSYIDVRNTWLPVEMVNNGDGSWSVTVNGKAVTCPNGTTLNEVLAKWYTDAGSFTIYITEIRGVRFPMYGTEIIAQAIAGSTATTAVTAPEGFEKAYEYASIPANTTFADVDISGYSEVKFNMWLDAGYICIIGWGAFAENAQWGKQWVPITLTNNGSSWTVSIEAHLSSSSGVLEAYPYTYEASGTKLSEVLATWFDFASDSASIYITEIRGIAKEGSGDVGGEEPVAPWATIIDNCVATSGGTLDTTVAVPAGFEYAYKLSGQFNNGNKSTTDLSNYTEVRFAVKATKYFLINGWTIYFSESYTDWATVVMKNNGNNSWTVSVYADVFVTGQATYSNPYVVDYTGASVNEILAEWESSGSTVYVTELRGEKFPAWGEKIVESALKDATKTNEVAPAGFDNVYTKTAFSTDFANANISLYSEVRFAIKSSSWVLLNNSWATYYDHRNWVNVVLTNNNNGTWTLQWHTQVQNTKGEYSASNPFTETVTGKTLKELVVHHSSNASATIYVTELRGLKKDLPEVEIPAAPSVGLETQVDTVLWGEQVTNNGVIGFSQANGVTVPNGYASVVAGTPATTANVDGVRVGEFFEEIDVSAYSEVRFAFKSSSWMLFGGWGSYVHVPGEWVSVSMKQTSAGNWTVTVYAKNAITGADPCTLTYSGNTLQEVLLPWYNAAGATFYFTDFRGVKSVADSSEIIDNCVVTAGATLDTTVAAPAGFEYAYKLSGQFNNGNKSTTDLSNYTEVCFAVKAKEYFLINSWGVYFKESYTDWAKVVMSNNGNNSWTVTVYADVFTGATSTVDNPYVITYTGTSVKEILSKWESSSDSVYVTELRGVKSELKSDVKISNLVCTTVYDAVEETAPNGYENVYTKDGLNKGDFANVDISSYSEVNFQMKANGWILFNGWSSVIDTRNTWLPVRLVNNGNNQWTATVNGESVPTASGSTLNAVLANWYSDYAENGGLKMYVTELRGVHGTYEASQIKAIAMLQADKSTQSKKAALELSALIKEITGVELLVEYYNSLNELDAHRRYILLGSFAASLVDAEALTTETGYIMQKVGNHVALYATTSNGMYNAVYGFLNAYYGLEFYTDTDMTYNPDGKPLIGGAETVVFNPSIEYAWAVDGLLTDGANDDYNWDYVNRLGYSNLYSQIGGGGWHNFLTIISEEKYGANGTVSQNASWFVSKTVDGQTFKTLNIATYGDAIAVAVANEFAAMINANPNVDVWQFSAPDYVDSAFTANDYVAFMNKVAANLNGQISRKVNLMLLAYNATYEAPTTDFVSQPNVGFTVMAAPIGMNYYYGFDNTTFTDSDGHTNAWYLEQITAWANKADELYIWNYSVYFDNYFVPLDTITNMQSKYQAYVNAGATAIYDQGSGEAYATDWAELKVYLKAELARNVNADVDTLIENFMKAYYGEAAAPYMMQLLEAQQAHYATIAANMNGGHITRDSLFNKTYWGTSNSNAMLTEWYGYIQSALNVTTDATLKARIQKESLTVRYLNQVLFNSGYTGNKTLTVTTVAGTTATDSLSQIITDAKALGITRFAEGQGWVCNDGTIIGTNNLKDGVIDNLA